MDAAISEFQRLRPCGIYKQDYLDDLVKKYGDIEEERIEVGFLFMHFRNQTNYGEPFKTAIGFTLPSCRSYLISIDAVISILLPSQHYF